MDRRTVFKSMLFTAITPTTVLSSPGLTTHAQWSFHPNIAAHPGLYDMEYGPMMAATSLDLAVQIGCRIYPNHFSIAPYKLWFDEMRGKMYLPPVVRSHNTRDANGWVTVSDERVGMQWWRDNWPKIRPDRYEQNEQFIFF